MIAAGRKGAVPNCDKQEIIRAMRAVFRENMVTEVRALKGKTPADRYAGTYSGYFDDPEALANAVAEIDWATGIYFIPNQVRPDLLARSVNKLRKVQSEPTTSDADIERRRWLLIDCDAIRPAGISASDEEHEASLVRAEQIKAALAERLWPDPIEGDSGNGAHLLYAIDLPAQDDGLVQRCLQALNSQFTDERVKVDQSVFNQSRIWKLPGTWARKGDDAPGQGRPHRMGRWFAIPDEIQVTPTVLLEELASESPSASATTTINTDNGCKPGSFDVEAFMREHSLSVRATHERNGTTFWVLDECPWNSDHRDKSAFIGRRATGHLIAGCKHDSCNGKGWHDLRAKLDPAWAERRAKWEQGNGSKSGSQKATPNGGQPEHDPSEAPCFDDDSGNYFLDKQRRGEAKHNSSVGSGFGNVDDEPADQAADAEPPFGPRPVGELLAAYPKLRPPVIDGLLRQGETANVIAAPKVGKSWAMLDMVFAVATGGKWLDRYLCEQGRALLVDNELHAETLSGRIRRLLVARQMDADQLGDWLHVDSLRGRLVDLYAMRKYFDRIEPGKYRLVVLDAFYRFLPKGTDENSNADVAALYNALDRYADRLGCAFALVHHSTKGSQSGKAITDVGAGAGSQSRATDTHIILRHHEEQGAVVFDAAVRSWAPVDPFCLRWQFPTWSLADDLDPAALRPERPPARKKKVDPEDNEFAEDKRPWDTHRFVAAFLGPEPILHADLIENAIAAGLSERLAKELLKRAEDQEKAFRWTFGRARPQKVATVKQPILKGIECEDGQS